MADDRTTVRGHTFWQARSDGRSAELTTATAIELDAEGCRWTVAPAGERPDGEPVASASRDVRRFMQRVVAAMHRTANRATVRPVPKPQPAPDKPLPPTAPTPCPLCLGEGWFDCEVCDGAGVVTARRAAAWRAEHGG